MVDPFLILTAAAAHVGIPSGREFDGRWRTRPDVEGFPHGRVPGLLHGSLATIIAAK